MEVYINKNVNDITYKSELIPTPMHWCGDLIRRRSDVVSELQFTSLMLRKLSTH